MMDATRIHSFNSFVRMLYAYSTPSGNCMVQQCSDPCWRMMDADAAYPRFKNI